MEEIKFTLEEKKTFLIKCGYTIEMRPSRQMAFGVITHTKREKAVKNEDSFEINNIFIIELKKQILGT